jgi:hypothetical protein
MQFAIRSMSALRLGDEASVFRSASWAYAHERARYIDMAARRDSGEAAHIIARPKGRIRALAGTAMVPPAAVDGLRMSRDIAMPAAKPNSKR